MLFNHLTIELQQELHQIYQSCPIPKSKVKIDGSPVTQLDLQASQAITKILKEYYPQDTIIDEEATHQPGTSNRTWYIDPVDSTTSYIRGGKDHTAIVGLWNHQPLYGFVYDFSTAKTYSTQHQPTAGTSNTHHFITSRRQRNVLHRFHQAGTPIDSIQFRNGTLKIIDVLEEKFDACFYAPNSVASWDVAGSTAIAAAAGCQVTTLYGTPFHPDDLTQGLLISRNPSLTKKMAESASNLW